MNRIKNYYRQAISNKWVKYAIYTVLVLGIILLLYVFVVRRKEFARTTAGRVYTAPEAKIGGGVAVDGQYFYAVGNNVIGKYLRKTGQRVAHQKYPFKNLTGGKIINGDLVVINNPRGHPEMDALIWINPDTLAVIDVMTIQHMQGKLAWVDWAWDQWWLCDAQTGKNCKESTIYCFDPDWNLRGYWKLPKTLVNKLSPQSLAGGSWFGEYLCVAGHDLPEIYILSLPEDKIHAKVVKTIQVCFHGQGFVFERGKGHVYAWGIRRDDGDVVRCAVDLE